MHFNNNRNLLSMINHWANEVGGTSSWSTNLDYYISIFLLTYSFYLIGGEKSLLWFYLLFELQMLIFLKFKFLCKSPLFYLLIALLTEFSFLRLIVIGSPPLIDGTSFKKSSLFLKMPFPY